MSAKSKYIEDRQYLIDKSSDPEKKRLSLGEEFERRVEQGKIVVSNGNYTLNPSKEDKKKVKEFGLKDGAKPDFLDFDKDGNKSESMKSALASKKTKTAKSGARTTMRGTGAALRGFRKAKLS